MATHTESQEPLKFDKYKWISAVMRSGVSPATKLRAWSLHESANPWGFSWPNQDAIEARIGNSSTGRTSSYMKELKEAGWIAVYYKQVDGPKKSAGYQLTWPTNVATLAVSAELADNSWFTYVDFDSFDWSPTDVGVKYF